MNVFLLDDEVLALTRPLRQPSAQKRFLIKIGVPFIVGAAGQPLISREALAARLAVGGSTKAAIAASQGPNREALLAHLGNRKKKGMRNGTTT
jgi:hypothetical protein